MSILITGSKGFVGSNLCSHLEKHGIEFVKFLGDITNKASYPKEKFDTIIHLAALITHHKNYTDTEIRRVNVDGTENILQFYADSKIIYISTRDVEKEDLTLYAKTKLLAENIVSTNPLNLIIRLPSVFGSGQKQDKLIPRLFKYYFNHENCELLNNDEREYIFVDEVSEKIINSLVESGIVSLQGIKIHNYRLKQLIGQIYLGITPSNLNPMETSLFNKLIKISKDYS